MTLDLNLEDLREGGPESDVAVEAMCAGAESVAKDRKTPIREWERLEIAQNGIVRATGDYDHEDEAMEALFWRFHAAGIALGKFAAERMRAGERNDPALRGSVQREIVSALFESVDTDKAIAVAESAIGGT